MKQKYIFILLAVLSAVFACTRIDEGQLGTEEPAQEKVQMTFTAVIDETDNTKTLLEGALGDGFRNVLWQPGDAIGVVSAQDDDKYNYSSVEKFVATIDEPALSSEFDGAATFTSSYKAFYPYSETVRDSSNCFIFNLPSQQKYVANSFDPSAAPMVAVANYGETFKFRNLCGVLALQLTGEEAVKSIVFSGFDEAENMIKVSGEFEVNPHQETLSVVPLWKSYGSVTMTCDKPVQLDPVNPTAFHMVLPAGTYSSFTVMIMTEDDKVMLKQATKPLTIQRSEVQPTANLMYVETEYIDLSNAGAANSYIVNGAGLYSFDASVIGNGIYGFIEGVSFHTDSPYIKPVKAKKLWEDRTGVLGEVVCNGDRVTFVATGIEGNALIAVTDINDEILWSWHIWVTDEPEEHTYINDQGNTYVMMDRALGSISAVEGEMGGSLFYQWGRKDPFRLNDATSLTNLAIHPTHLIVDGNFSNLSSAVQAPTSFASWSDWVMDINAYLWSNDMKTIYDPCPAGWRVPVREVWNGIRVKHDRDGGPYGVVLHFTDEDYFWYPDTPRIGYGSDIEESYTNDRTEIWTSDFGITRYITYSQNSENTRARGDGHPVRCMKDDGYEATCVPMVKIKGIKDIVADGALVEARISAQGLTPVTECGIVWGTSSDITLENASYQAVNTESNDFSYTISGLEKATRYYVRAYAKNENGVGYSAAQYFITDWEGEAINLSKDGTANCYIVPLYYAEYSFDASVKGNSKESVGELDSVEVLWETPMNYNSINVGDIINNVRLVGNEVHFELSREPIPGNALVAVKDVNGTIVWSWHIWVVDFNPEETQATLHNGAVIMDRNLGALSSEPNLNDFAGLMYQWGRKDPFMIYGNWVNFIPSDAIRFEYYDPNNDYIENAVQNPCVVYNDAQWNGKNNLWGIQKTMYDPCPIGWKVSESGIWNGLYMADGDWHNHYFELSSACADKTVYFPLNGHTTGDSYVDGGGYLWTSNRRSYVDIWWSSTNICVSTLDVDYLLGIRCMKDAKAPSGGSDDYTQSDDYEW